MDYSSFGREGPANFDDANFIRRMSENPRKPPKYIDLNQAPDDTNDMPSVWRRWIENIALGIILGIMALSAVLYKLMVA